MKSGLFLDVVVRESSAILKLLASEDQTLLVWGDSLLVLDLSLDILNGIAGLNLQGDGFPCESLDEDLHSSTESEDQMESGLFLDVVVRQSSAILQSLASKDQTLLVWGNSLLVPDLSLDILNGIAGLNLQGDGLPCESLDKDLHSSTESKDQMESGLFLDVVVGQSSAILQLLASKDQTLLVWGDSLLVLDLCLDVLDGIARLHLQGNGLPCERLDEDLHSSTESEDQMESGLFLDVVVRQSSAILQLLASEDQTLLVWGDSLLVLDLSLHILDGIARLNLQSDGLAGEGLDEDLHRSPLFVACLLN